MDGKPSRLSGGNVARVRKWPFTYIVDACGGGIGWVVVNAHIISPERQRILAELRAAGYRFMGMTSDGEFPRGSPRGPGDARLLCEAWCHCFRNPVDYLPPGRPQALISASDFTDYMTISRETVERAGTAAFDFVYVGATEPWKREAKNWSLARRCIPQLAREGLRGLVVGAPDDPIDGATIVPVLPWRELLGLLAGVRFLFVPNVDDASPRVLAEALCLDVPLVVNRRILGGWKYVNASTGVFFDDEQDVVSAVQRCLAVPRRPAAWFRAHHGPYHAGHRLLELVGSLDRSIAERSHLGLADTAH